MNHGSPQPSPPVASASRYIVRGHVLNGQTRALDSDDECLHSAVIALARCDVVVYCRIDMHTKARHVRSKAGYPDVKHWHMYARQ